MLGRFLIAFLVIALVGYWFGLMALFGAAALRGFRAAGFILAWLIVAPPAAAFIAWRKPKCLDDYWP